MQQCPYIPQIGAYRDGELADARRAEIEAHLAACAECAAELAELKELSELFERRSPEPQLSAEAIQRYHEQVDALADRNLRRFAEVLSGLAAALLLGTSIWLLQAPQAEAQTTVPPWYSAVAPLEVRPATETPIHAADWIVAELTSRPEHD